MYVGCEEGADCDAPADGCWHVTLVRSDGTTGDGALCTAACVTDADCPEEGVCLAIDGDPDRVFLCWQRCETSSDCYAGQRCTETTGTAGATSICLP